MPEGVGRRTKKTLPVRSRRTPLAGNNMDEAHKWKQEEARYIENIGNEMLLSSAPNIRGRGRKVDRFLMMPPSMPGLKTVTRKLSCEE